MSPLAGAPMSAASRKKVMNSALLGRMVSYLQDQRERAQLQFMGIAVRELLDTLGRCDDKKLIGFAKFLEKTARTTHHKAQLRQLIDLWEDGHPSITLATRLFNDVHPNCRNKLIYNMGVKATWQGEQKRREFKKKEGIRPPFLAVISPTNRCNLKCTGCYSGLFPRDIPDPMSWETFDRIVTECKEMGIHFFTISGGEPFVRKDLLDMFEKHQDCMFHVFTNSTKITDKHIAKFIELGNVLPSISVEGFAEQTDGRRGSGVWASVMDTMDRLKSAGIIFGFSATATRMNADMLASEEFVDLMVEKGCIYGWMFLMTPTGKDDDPYFMPTPEQRDRLRAHVMEVRREKPIFVADFWNDGCLTDGCLAGGSLYFHVNFKGDVEPCVFIHYADMNVFELHEQGGHLKDIVFRSPFFVALRERNRRDPNRLRPCPIIDHNEYLEESIHLSGAYPTHPGADSIITDHKEAVRSWGEAYGELAEKAWNSGEYDFFKKGSHLWMADEEDWLPTTVEHLSSLPQGGCQSFSMNHGTAGGGCGSGGCGSKKEAAVPASGISTLLNLKSPERAELIQLTV